MSIPRSLPHTHWCPLCRRTVSPLHRHWGPVRKWKPGMAEAEIDPDAAAPIALPDLFPTRKDTP